VKPVPVIEAELTVTAELPDEVSVTVCVAGEFNVTLPKDRLVELRLSVGVELGFNCTA